MTYEEELVVILNLHCTLLKRGLSRPALRDRLACMIPCWTESSSDLAKGEDFGAAGGVIYYLR